MSMVLSRGDGGGDYTPMPAGQFGARCFGIYDLGTQISEYKGQEKRQRKIKIVFEVPQHRIEIDGKDLPMSISSTFTATFDDRGHLLKFLNHWRGKPLSEKELDGFDVKNLLGVPAMLQVIHEKSNDGKKTFANIGAIMSLPESDAPPAESEHQWFTFDEGFDIPEYTPKRTRQKIEESVEWQEYEAGNDALAQDKVTDSSGNEITNTTEDDDLPF